MQPELRTDGKKSGDPYALLLYCGCIFFFYCAMMGDWPLINKKLGGLPKIMSAGIVGIAALHFFVTGDFKRIRETLRFAPVYFTMILMLLLWSLLVWVLNFTPKSSMPRAAQKMLFQSVTICNVLACCYLVHEKAIDVYFTGLCLANFSIMVLEVPSYGIAGSLNSLIHCLITLGDAQGYIKQLELHDITFTFGQCLIYYTMFAPKDNPRDKLRRRISIALCIFFMIVGLKRSTFPAVALICCYAWFIRKQKKPFRWIILSSVLLMGFQYFYVWFVREGYFTALMNLMGVDMLGRDTMWMNVNDYFTMSPTYMGRGFEAVDSIISEWVSAGILSKRLPFHNDYLKVFVELGFGGFTLWSMIQCIFYPWYWGKKHSTEAALLYFCVFAYMSITYLTDNTAFYFWSSTGLRMMPLTFVMRFRNPKPAVSKWQPPTSYSIAEDIRMLELGKE